MISVDDEYVDMGEERDKLGEGESLVAVSGDISSGYFIHIGDKNAANTWAVTWAEMLALRDLLVRKFEGQ